MKKHRHKWFLGVGIATIINKKIVVTGRYIKCIKCDKCIQAFDRKYLK